jgi:hypothetical protein
MYLEIDGDFVPKIDENGLPFKEILGTKDTPRSRIQIHRIIYVGYLPQMTEKSTTKREVISCTFLRSCVDFKNEIHP